ncbi:crotonase/enoyl-CoA hydratase family protein [Oceanobacillus halophilus]|uniref:crotonase/enoyl-CoA hydratase family protein n=1 Tax=Oceanobacillus halophilus TaxID=930130 RepID=UPI0019D4C10C|nr:crotonase/enoyl-CoA hydratase family protein [Oceanobacillus halophilus]
MKTLKTTLQNGILTITLARPQQLNAFNGEMLSEFIEVLDNADTDDAVKVVVVTGEGKAFCAGADLEKGGATFNYDENPEEFRDEGGLLTLRLYEMKKPVIAAINGPAVGVGITMTLPMDIRIASSRAKMGFVFTRRGIVPESCSSWFLPKIVGISKASYWVLTGNIFKAEEAVEAGLVSELVPPEQLLDRAYEIASEIVENTSAISVTLSKQLLWRMSQTEHPIDAHLLESKLIQWTGSRADAKEGVTSFLEKRKAKFTMKVSKDMPDFYPWWEKS